MSTTSRMSRPLVVTLAVIFLAIVCAIGLTRQILGARSYDFRVHVEFATTFLLEAVVCWFIFRGKNWARWALVAVFVLGAGLTLPRFIARVQHISPLRTGNFLVGMIADLIVLFALFHPSSSRWFGRQPCTAPNGGPATQVGDSGVMDGRP